MKWVDYRWRCFGVCEASTQHMMAVCIYNTVSGGPVAYMRTIWYPRRYGSHLSGDLLSALVASPSQSEAHYVTWLPILFIVIILKLNLKWMHINDIMIHHSIKLTIKLIFKVNKFLSKSLSFSLSDQLPVRSALRCHVTHKSTLL